MQNDKIFTPEIIVNKMLDEVNFKENLLDKLILEPSFGDGNILYAIVQRVLNECKLKDISNIYSILDNIYGIEIDKELYEKCLIRLNNLLIEYGYECYTWPNLYCDDLLLHNFTNKFDFIIGNPPYIRIHDLSESIRNRLKSFNYSKGNTDLYIIFYEVCLNLLHDSGKLCFITPNSWMKNNSQKNFRKFLAENDKVEKIIDFGDYLVFKDVGTYTSITILSNNNDNSNYILMLNESDIKYNVEINVKDFMEDAWVFSDDDSNKFISEIKSRNISLGDLCEVQNGLATNADSVYIIDSNLYTNFEPELLRPVVKGSTLEDNKYIIFPYKWDSKLNIFKVIDEDTMKEYYPKTYSYLFKYKDKLLSRNMDSNSKYWYQYARGQGIQNSNHKKIALRLIVKDDMKEYFKPCGKDTLIYSGLMLILKDESNLTLIEDILNSTDFLRYLCILGKDMRGGYKSINSKIVKSFKINIKNS